MRPAAGGGLKASGQSSVELTSASTVITTNALTDLPVISAMLSRLFESSQYVLVASDSLAINAR